MKICPTLLAGVLSVVLLAGCQSRNAAFSSQETTKYSIESTGKFARLDEVTQAAVICTGLQERPDQEGRLEVVANIKNRGSSSVRVQVKCVFKDTTGFATGDETDWKILMLESDATEAVRFNAGNGVARKYTVVVRQAP